MKKSRQHFILAMALALLVGTNIKAEAKLIKDIRTSEDLGPGVSYVQIDCFTDKGWIDIGVLKLQTSNEYSNLVGLTSPHGSSHRSTLTSMMNTDDKVIGGINGDFFTYGTYPMALGSLYANNELILSTPEQAFSRNNFYIKKDGTAGVGNINNNIKITNHTRATSINVNALNKVSAPFSAVSMLDNNWGVKSPGKALGPNVTEVLITANKVVDKRVGQEGFNIPFGSKVLTVVGPDLINFNPGDTISIDMGDYDNLKFSIGGGNILVKDGKVNTSSLSTNKDPRTAIGINADGSYIHLVTVDGRNGKSIGMSERELADFMRSIGCVQSINLDGGGSTTMAIKRQDQASAQVENSPSGNSQRSIANGVGIRADAPLSKPNYIKIKADSTEVFPGFSYGMNLEIYDIHHNLLDVNQSEISVSLGEIPLGPRYFSASTPGWTSINASLGEATGSLDILVRDPISEIFLNTEELRLEPGQAHVFDSIYGINAKGYRKNIPTSMVSFELIGDIGSMDANTFTAGQTPSAGALMASFNGVKKYIPVSVGHTQSLIHNFHNPSRVNLSSLPNDPNLVVGRILDDPEGLNLTYSVANSKDERRLKLELEDEILIGPADYLSLNISPDGNAAKIQAVLVDENGVESIVEFENVMDKKENVNINAKLDSKTYRLKSIDFVVDRDTHFDSTIRLNSISSLTYPKMAESLIDLSNINHDPNNYPMENPTARISIGSVKPGDQEKMAHMSNSQVSLLYNGMGLTSVKSPIRILGNKDYFHVETSHDTKFIQLETNGTSLRSANPNQWQGLLEELENSSEMNIILIGKHNPGLISGPKEKALFDQTIQNVVNSGKNVFIVYQGEDFSIKDINGYKEVTLDSKGNSYKILDIYIGQGTSSYYVEEI